MSEPTIPTVQQQPPPAEDPDAIVAVEALASPSNEDTVRQRRRSVREEIPLATLQSDQHDSITTDPTNEPSTSAFPLDEQEIDNYIPAMENPLPPSRKLRCGDVVLICVCIFCLVVIVYCIATIIYFYA